MIQAERLFPEWSDAPVEAREAWREVVLELGLDPDNQHKAQKRLTQKSD